MNYTIYIRKTNWNKFKDEENKAELVNTLLNNHYGGNKLPEALKPVALSEADNYDPEADGWRWDAYRKIIVNTNTGETSKGDVVRGKVVNIYD
jgi:hypothetical protein